MSPLKGRVPLVGAMLLMALVQRAQAAVETIPPSEIPPPPGELVLTFPNPPPPSFDRVHLHFSGSASSNYSSHTTLTWRFDWTLPSGELAYSVPITYGLDPGRITQMDGTTAVEGCPSFVSLDFTTQSPVGATVSGTLEHTCTIPEPASFALFAFAVGSLTLARSQRRARCSRI